MPAVVDTVLTGSTLKIVTLPERAVLTFAVAGAQSPNVRRMPDGALEGDPFGREVRTYRLHVAVDRCQCCAPVCPLMSCSIGLCHLTFEGVF